MDTAEASQKSSTSQLFNNVDVNILVSDVKHATPCSHLFQKKNEWPDSDDKAALQLQKNIAAEYFANPITTPI